MIFFNTVVFCSKKNNSSQNESHLFGFKYGGHQTHEREINTAIPANVGQALETAITQSKDLKQLGLLVENASFNTRTDGSIKGTIPYVDPSTKKTSNVVLNIQDEKVNVTAVGVKKGTIGKLASFVGGIVAGFGLVVVSDQSKSTVPSDRAETPKENEPDAVIGDNEIDYTNTIS